MNYPNIILVKNVKTLRVGKPSVSRETLKILSYFNRRVFIQKGIYIYIYLYRRVFIFVRIIIIIDGKRFVNDTRLVTRSMK